MPKILFVDNDEDTRNMICCIFTYPFFEVVCANSVQEALQLFVNCMASEKFDLVLTRMDMHNPFIGTDLARQIDDIEEKEGIEIKSRTPVIIRTGDMRTFAYASAVIPSILPMDTLIGIVTAFAQNIN